MEYGRVAGTIEVCGRISERGVNSVFLLEGALYSQQYISSCSRNDDGNAIIVHDNHAVHMSKAVQSHIQQTQMLEFLP